MKIVKPIVYTTTAASLLISCNPQSSEKKVNVSKPNIIYILADDLGYGDLSCYGQQKFQTPNIDKLAENGMRFTQHYAGCTVSAPSRCVLMTGKHTGHAVMRGNKRMKPEGQYPMSASEVTIAELLKEKDYVNGAFGKWGLGFHDNEGGATKQGFDRFYGYYCQSLAHRYYPDYIWDNETKVDLHNDGTKTIEYAQDMIHKEAIKFIEANKDTNFFLFLPYVIPHAELIVPEDSIIQKYRGKLEPEKVYKGQDYGENFKSGGYCSCEETHAVFAAMVTRLDIYVGQVMAKLEELGISDNTIVMFSSDNGPHLEGGADPDYFNSNGPLKGYKRDLYEGGVREPFIVSWPGVIKKGSESDHISAFWDFLPTVCDITGIEVTQDIDGISFYPELIGKEQVEHDYLYWEFYEKGGRKAIRKGDWKAVVYNVLGGENNIELYDLSKDIGEENNVAAEHPEIVIEMDSLMHKAHVKSDIFTMK